MTLLIKNGTVVTDAGLVEADICCSAGTIEAILRRGAARSADGVLDAAGKLVFPGFIDPHVHSRDPGQTEKETFSHSTLGALCGGVTTILEMPNAIPAVVDAETFVARSREHAEKAWVDFGLWGMALGPSNLAELEELFAAGAVGVKFFWGYALDKKTKALVYNYQPGRSDELLLPPENGEVLELFRTVAGCGGLLAAHCEDRHVLASAAAGLEGPVETYDDLLRSRPAVAESAAIALGAEFSAATGCRFHVVHLSSAAGAAVVSQARARGVPITAETCPHYLTLTDEDGARLGPLMKVYPPVRDRANQDALWSSVREGSIGSIGSDHAPHLAAEKALGFGQAPAGGLGVETLAPLMVDAMLRGELTPERLAEVLSTGTAKLYGLWPRKGAVNVGADADFSIVDPVAHTEVRNEAMHALNPVTAWDGKKLRGRMVASVLRGEVVMVDGAPVGTRRGQFVAASHGKTKAPVARR